MLKRLWNYLFSKTQPVQEGQEQNNDPLGNVAAVGHIVHVLRMENIFDLIDLAQKDYSEHGFQSALRLPDMNYANQILHTIKAMMLNYTARIEAIYNRRENELKLRINQYEQMMLLDMKENEEQKLRNLQEEVNRLQQLRKEIEEEIENGIFDHMKRSFLVGFTRGVAYLNSVKANNHSENVQQEKSKNENQ